MALLLGTHHNEQGSIESDPIDFPNDRPDQHQTVELGFVIVTQDSIGGMVDMHDRRPVVLGPADAWRWMDKEMPVEEAAHIAQSRSSPTEEFRWWRVSRNVNRSDPSDNGQHLLEPILSN